MTTRAWIRDLHGDDHPAPFDELGPDRYAVQVAGIGFVVLSRRPDKTWGAALSAGTPERDRATGGPHDRPVVEFPDHLEVEVLPNDSAEDRIVVCLAVAAEPG